MLWLKSFHLIAMVAWFAGLFYLPRLFVYHVDVKDEVSQQRFKTMERRLYYGIMWPAALLTTILGFGLVMMYMPYVWHAMWFHIKIMLVLLLWLYHISCGSYMKKFAKNMNCKTSRYFRFFNEIPTIFLILIVVMVVVKPIF